MRISDWSSDVCSSDLLACADLPDAPCILAASDLLRAAVTRSAGWTDEELDAAQSRLAGVILDEIRELPHEALGLPMPREVRLVKIARALSEKPAEDRRLEERSEERGGGKAGVGACRSRWSAE